MDAITFLPHPLNKVPGMFAADEMAFNTALTQSVRQRQTTHDMTRTNLQRGIGTENHLAYQFSACIALNSHSARTQSSCVSISWTRWRGNTTGTERSPKMGRSSSQADVRPQ